MFSDVGDSAKKYKTAIFKRKLSKFWIFRLVPRSPTHAGLICGKPWSRMSQAWAPLKRPSGQCPWRQKYLLVILPVFFTLWYKASTIPSYLDDKLKFPWQSILKEDSDSKPGKFSIRREEIKGGFILGFFLNLSSQCMVVSPPGDLTTDIKVILFI